MPEPTELEKSLVDKMKRMADRMESGNAGTSDLYQSNALMLRVLIAEHSEGRVTVKECENIHKLLEEKVKSSQWNINKAAAVVLSTLTACGSLVTLVIKLS